MYYHCLKNWQTKKLRQLKLHYEVFMQNIGRKFQRLIYFHLLVKIQLCFNNWKPEIVQKVRWWKKVNTKAKWQYKNRGGKNPVRLRIAFKYKNLFRWSHKQFDINLQTLYVMHIIGNIERGREDNGSFFLKQLKANPYHHEHYWIIVLP